VRVDVYHSLSCGGCLLSRYVERFKVERVDDRSVTSATLLKKTQLDLLVVSLRFEHFDWVCDEEMASHLEAIDEHVFVLQFRA
jgi:hypothetical protein